MKLNNQRIGDAYKKIIEFMDSHDGQLPCIKSNTEEEKEIALLYRNYYKLFSEEQLNEINMKKTNKQRRLYVIRNYINFIKKYKRRPVYNVDNEYELSLYESFQRIENDLEEDEKILVSEVVSKINKFKENRLLYQEMLRKRGEK